MSFQKKGQTNLGSVNTGQKLDSSQLGKLQEGGYQVTPISNDPSILSSTIPTTKQVMPGVSVEGYSDIQGNFYVLSEDNKVHDVKFFGNNLNNAITGIPNLPSAPTLPNVQTPVSFAPPSSGGGSNLTPPPPNLGSGKVYSRFESGDIVPNQQETVTRALWSGNVGNLTSFYTSSGQTSTQKRYYYEVFNSASGDCGSEAQFSIIWGHKQGSGSADEGGQINDTPSRAIYGQFKQLLLDPGTERFVINGTATDHIYGISVNRSRMREALDEGNIELNLQRLSGSQFLSGGGAQNAHTGSNVKVFPTQAVLRLIDDSRVANATITTAGEVYNIVSGTIEDGIFNSSAPHYYGLLYRRHGTIILDGTKMDQSCSFLTVTGSEIPGDNAYKLFKSISGSAKYTDASGDILGFQGRSSEKVKSTHFFVRVKNQEYNFSNNPTFVTGSEGDLAEPTFIGDPTVFVTGVGLYNDSKELLAVAKTSQPIKKKFNTEALLKIKLEFAWISFLFASQFLS